MAMGILGVGLVLIAMVFPVGVKLTSVAAERTIGTIAANEAFAKMQQWGFPLQSDWLTVPGQASMEYVNLVNAKYRTVPGWILKDPAWDEFLYPSAATQGQPRSYHWSGLCRRIDERQVQVTVFLTRKIAADMRYYSQNYYFATHNYIRSNEAVWPSPVPVMLQYNPSNLKELRVLDGAGNEYWNLNPGQTRAAFGFFDNNTVLVDDRNGNIYTVMEYKASTQNGPRDTLVLLEGMRWNGYAFGAAPLPSDPLRFWVIPPGVGSTRNPVIGVVQKTLTLEQ